MTLRWLCYDSDIIFVLRYKTVIHAMNNSFEIAEKWSCKEGDQFLITNRIGSEKYILDKDTYITLDTNQSINGVLHEIFNIYPGDRIVWIRKLNTIFDIDKNNYKILFILDCEYPAKIAGFSNPNNVFLSQGFPLQFGYNPLTKEPTNKKEIIQKLKNLDIPNTWESLE